MKTRQGFVSNSSTSSFCIYGAGIEKRAGVLINEDRLKELGLEVHYGEFDELYVGKSWKLIGDNETGYSFKQSIIKSLHQIYGNDIRTGTIEQAWRDG